jgi:TPR repeat protein
LHLINFVRISLNHHELNVKNRPASHWYQRIIFVCLAALPTSAHSQSYSEDALQCYQTFASSVLPDALRFCSDAAALGDAEAQFKLATLYAQGNAVEKNLVTAAHWLKKASQQGHLEATYNLAFAYQNGNGLSRDLAQAAALYKTGAEAGHSKSQRNLAYLYETGSGVPQDSRAAFKWHSKTAESGSPRGQLRIGLMLIEGRGTPMDRERGMALLLKAAETGEADAQFFAGLMLIEEDPETGVPWYQKAIDQGHTMAMYQYAKHLALEGNSPDELQRAFQLADKAVKAGSQESIPLLDSIREKLNRTAAVAGAAPVTPPVTPPVTEPAAAMTQDVAKTPNKGPAQSQRRLQVDNHWLESTLPKAYTIQLISLSSPDRVRNFVDKYQLKNARNHPTERDGRVIYIVTYGEFESRDAASMAIEKLPQDLQKLKPMIKQFDQFQLSQR